MGHELQLKLDVSAKPATSGKNQTIDSSSEQGDAKLKPFSSALEEQLEKQPVEQKKTTKPQMLEKAEKAQASQSEDVPAEEVVMQDGNVLPKETEETDIDLVLTEEIDIETDVDLVVTEEIEIDIETDIDLVVTEEVDVETDIDVVVTEEIDVEVEGDVSAVERVEEKVANVTVNTDVEHEETKDVVADQPNNAVVLEGGPVVLPTKLAKPTNASAEIEKKPNANANIIAGSKRPVLRKQQIAEQVQAAVVSNVRQDNMTVGSEDKKQQGPILRSDILNALNSKMNGGNEKIEGSTSIKTDKVIAAQSQSQSQLLEKPIANLSKVIEQLSQRKTGAPQLRDAPERHVSGLVTALTHGIASASATAAVQATAAGQPVLAMQPAMQSEAWGRVLSSRVVWMAREGVQQAELRLNPANLGSIDVKLHMNNEQANVTFIAQNAATRDALEQALPRLRESFQENGMDLANANVSDQEAEQNNEEDKSDNSSTITKMASDELDAENDSIESDELELGVSVFA